MGGSGRTIREQKVTKKVNEGKDACQQSRWGKPSGSRFNDGSPAAGEEQQPHQHWLAMPGERVFRHGSPSGETVADRVRQADIEYRLAGENLARTTASQSR